jgi:predicted adenylyl cyclase CyaB
MRYLLLGMPTNIEIKARLKDINAARAAATGLSGRNAEVLHQLDIFFPCPRARLKLRIFGPSSGELIRYQRPGVAEARGSSYLIARTQDPHVLRDILTDMLGTLGVVRKTRQLFLVGQTRVHIDNVDGLGEFLELEVVLRPDQSDTGGREIIRGLLSEFAINPAELVPEAYVDLIRRQQE